MISSTLGFPRIGPRRELKRALEDYWAGNISVLTSRWLSSSKKPCKSAWAGWDSNPRPGD